MSSVFRNAILCDDIRQEKNNKYILIGVFSGDVVASQFPAALAFSVYAEHVTDGPGHHDMAIRFSLSGEHKAEVRARIDMPIAGTATIVLPPMPIELQAEGELLVTAQLDDAAPVELIRKRVIQGVVAT